MTDPISSTATSVGTVQRPEAPEAEAQINSDFETFLRMMTVQVQNQDPLNPIDATDYATQLATFSTVEQQVQTNELLKQMTDLLGGDGLQSASGWIGMDALVQAPVFFDQQAALTVRPDLDPDATSGVLVIRDAEGATIQRVGIDPGQETVVWDGRNDGGTLMPSGSYRFETESYDGDTLLATRLSPAYDRVVEVRQDGSDVLVSMAGGAELPRSMITGLRVPPT